MLLLQCGKQHLDQSLTSRSNSKDIYVAAYDPNGQFLWAQQFGNANDELYPDIAADASGVTVLGSFKGTFTIGSTSSNAALNNGNNHCFMVRMDLGGAFQWLNTGGSVNEDIPAGITSDGSRLYVGMVGGSASVSWYNSAGAVLGTSTLTSKDHRYIAFSTAGSWAWSTGITDPTNGSVGFPNVALGCDGLFVSGAVSAASSFPSMPVSAGGTGSEYFYAARLNKSTGTAEWVKWGTTTNGGEHFNGRDITIGKYGLVHIGGTYNGTVSFGGQSMTSASGQDLFILTLKPDGTFKTLYPDRLNGDEYLS
ncbi:MAG: hypothetical protein IPO56_16505, partial [Flavobacteriales bacterium]|nr:hypothetical protein [Flavobacteriales bacterium]